MKVWITKYALTQGIIEADADKISNDGYCRAFWSDKKGYECNSLFHPKHFKRDKESAVNEAGQMRKKKIASLEKQIEKLKKIKFE